MTYSIQSYIKVLHRARMEKGWTQKELSGKTGLTQAHLSRLERGEVDLRLSSFIELSRVLDMEVVLVPRSTVPAVKALIMQSPRGEKANTKPAYALDDEENDP